MERPKSAKFVPFVCSTIVLILLFMLGFAQKFVRPVRIEFEAGPRMSSTAPSFDLTRKFQIIQSQNKGPESREISLGELLEESPTLIVNFWATWCPPCIEEMPSIEFLHRGLSRIRKNNSAPKLVAISVDDKKELVQILLKGFDFTPSMTVLWNPGGDFARSVGSHKFPETYWINRQGISIHKWIGPQNWLSYDVLLKFALH